MGCDVGGDGLLCTPNICIINIAMTILISIKHLFVAAGLAVILRRDIMTTECIIAPDSILSSFPKIFLMLANLYHIYILLLHIL